MPHDCTGNELKAGDLVILRAVVRASLTRATGRNVTIEALDPLDCGEARLFTCNSSLLEKDEAPDGPVSAARTAARRAVTPVGASGQMPLVYPLNKSEQFAPGKVQP